MPNHYYRKIVWSAAIFAFMLVIVFWHGKPAAQQPTSVANQNAVITSSSNATSSSTPQVAASQAVLAQPLANALSRITKKPFGLYVTPKNSPVQPERFTGYHTGVDFETTADEQNLDVPVSAVCSGPLAMKKWASGYGGVAVQSCKLQGQDVTIIYGHLNIDSVTLKVGEQINAGDKIGILGQGYSQQTDGERKHLHLGIHKGTSINILGYVQNKADLANWIDAQSLLK